MTGARADRDGEDLAPGRSLAEFAVCQGIETFMIVWRNPGSLLGHGRLGVDDYLAAQERAAEVVKKITRGEKVNWLGLCAGGMTLAYMLAHLAATGDDSAGSATFIVTMLSGRQLNVVGMLDTGQSRVDLEQAAAAGQIVAGTALRSLFALLRPNELVFNYLVSGWLMGEPPAAFDVLAWNDDATRTTAKFAPETTRMGMDGWAGGGPTLLGVPTDFGKVSKELTVVRSGHIQSFVYPADDTRYDCWYGPPQAADPDEWMSTATVQRGSWWRRRAEWLIARSGSEWPARTTLGDRQYPPLGPAPSHYVHQ